MILIISVLFWGMFIFFLAKLFLGQGKALKPFFIGGLLIKSLAGICVGLVYTYYYSAGDTFGFFSDAQLLNTFFYKMPSDYFNFILFGDQFSDITNGLLNEEGRSLFLIKNLSLVSLVSFDNYWVSSIAFSIISFLGCWYALDKVIAHFPEGKWAAVISFLFVPTFVFWSSGIIKESLAVAALMFLAGFLLTMVYKAKSKPWEWFFAFIAILFLWKLKYYWAALFIPTAITTVLLVRLVLPVVPGRNKLFETLLWIVVFGFIVLGASNIHPNFYLSRFLHVVVENHNAYVIASHSGPVVHFYNLEPRWGSVVMNSPWALFSGLFRPVIFESVSFFQIVIAIENLLLLVLFIFNMRYILNAWNSKYRLLIIGAVVYICLLAIFLTLSTPNFGTLSRYRVGFLPFFFFLLSYYPSQVVLGKIVKLKID
ncbi:MAG: hypothetical protein K8H85_00560 [Cyclobacteriaceae bacterium]|nr:hypothetical protein [Cyclobacteriaceae bacterium]